MENILYGALGAIAVIVILIILGGLFFKGYNK